MKWKLPEIIGCLQWHTQFHDNKTYVVVGLLCAVTNGCGTSNERFLKILLCVVQIARFGCEITAIEQSVLANCITGIDPLDSLPLSAGNKISLAVITVVFVV